MTAFPTTPGAARRPLPDVRNAGTPVASTGAVVGTNLPHKPTSRPARSAARFCCCFGRNTSTFQVCATSTRAGLPSTLTYGYHNPIHQRVWTRSAWSAHHLVRLPDASALSMVAVPEVPPVPGRTRQLRLARSRRHGLRGQHLLPLSTRGAGPRRVPAGRERRGT